MVTHDVRAEVAAVHRELKAHAAAEEWDRVASLTRHRDELLAAAPHRFRALLLQAAIDCNQSLLESALAARKSAADRLGSMRRGRRQVERYAAQSQAT